jgi:Asp-tRNA(Asn)/Glu-tRNA(Gln) amidotransferase A subunit family amidase
LTIGLCGFFFAASLEAQRANETFEVMEMTIPELQRAMAENRTTSRELVHAYLKRIEAFDVQGPKLNAIIAINPNALREADQLDAERARGNLRGPLHGIPVILKDNFNTADIPTTASSIGFAGFIPSDDAFQVRKLREAGAIILAKSNMGELASGITTMSSLGGQTRNPYDPDRNPGGSSGGTGAAIAASFAAVGMGTDTCGSIRIPAAHNGLVGLRPTKGLSNTDGIVPMSLTQDVAGPLARSVTDLAIVLDVTIGEDADDSATHLESDRIQPQFVESLDENALRGARLGLLTTLLVNAQEDEEVARVIRTAFEEMKKHGAVTSEIAIPELTELLRNSSVIDMEFREDLAGYLAKNPEAPLRSLAEILERGLYHASHEAAFLRRNAAGGRNSEEYRNALEAGELYLSIGIRAETGGGLRAQLPVTR